MTAATREALEKVHQILHEAEWDSPPDVGSLGERLASFGRQLDATRSEYEQLVRDLAVALQVRGPSANMAG